ncbi:MAG: tRNA uridine-5-carboxymethylaminomethyl(34) synthesis GTPase MnmE [Gammaproteobacteria bacterium]|nr:tRNA uridine-5-carboxymethylaminomethyl(34) synthesis GTPase MnmE [Gammaproteobacteria bacterium]MDH3372134.1 tRNA uridine-5-carboxymethylaminomethyl(34) synthesis GTPase MnmE [Gammaproteobacteria bacterium]MDH3410701.1 tRNA uridine-5-carboxymethylaminomethyl(34) synthesis GTPase MnmE [Gammaproteobacteria bacterium]MDH3552215.1 tRNA uridine-5-carboxymethylaminomethyl(34) synthesis GTPase MnmE [Gammaproteobacteria bacterium]
MTSAPDTIVATATPAGTAGVGIVRLSGSEAERIARGMLGSLPEPRYATYRTFRNARGEKLDSGVALYFPAPASFTGEAVLELHGHGGPVVMSLLVDAAIEFGARLAEPGEFTKRAFLNGKLDLAQAEAIADLIGSGTAQAARAALRSLSGAFSGAVDTLAERLVRLRMHVEAAIDFPEEEIDFLSDEALLSQLEDCRNAFDELQNQAAVGRVLRDGFRVVIVGKPNAGKSSLLNKLSGEESAIVTEVAGTTRDVLREQINIDGLAVELVDTAGLRDNPDRIEAEGIRRAREALTSADAVLWIQDASDSDDAAMGEEVPDGAKVTVVRNKIDLTGEEPGAASDGAAVINLSAKTGAGIDALRERLRALAGYENLGEGAFTARKRHIDALSRAAAHFVAGCAALDESRAGELLAEELRLAHEALGEITGAMSSDDLLGRIFADFCIGK